MSQTLTSKTVENLKPGKKRREILDPAMLGFYVIVQTTGVKSFAYRYRVHGKFRKLTLGRWPQMGLAEARRVAAEAAEAVLHGRDPGAEKIAEKAAAEERANRDAIEKLMEVYARRHLSTLKSGDTIKRELDRHAVAAWRGREVRDISRRDVIELLDGLVDSGRAVSANRLRAYLGKFFNWCLERDVIDGTPMAGVKRPAKERSRDRVLTDDELRYFMSACERVGEPWGPMGLLLLLTGQRLGEVCGMTDKELDGDTWQLSGDRTKNGRAHSVPLSGAALDVLAGVTRIKSRKELIFTTTGDTPVSGFDGGKNAVVKAMVEVASEEAGQLVEIPHWTFHDLRRSTATGMARLGVSPVVIEACLNHISGARAGVAGVYNRFAYEDEKWAALDAWANFLSELVEEPRGNVVRLERPRL